jgi:hypothetical protein
MNLDTLALYFNRVHPSERGEQTFGHVLVVPRAVDSISPVPHGAVAPSTL